MKQYYVENVTVLVVGIAIAVVGLVFPESGRILRYGGAIGLAGLFTVKGVSRLRCKPSDVAFSIVVLGLISLSKWTHTPRFSLAIEIVVLSLVPFFLVTGLTFRSIVRDRRHGANSKKQP
ncbi:MAG TPA: hypothetical protein VMU05_12795 [Dongiaceae bacterium]|nr:hypothetical protein [Dongiaceae bacterium]